MVNANEEQRVRCQRTGQDYNLGEHKRCPYCWGSSEAVRSGEHERFCEFKPGADPIHFGFPEEGNRLERG